MDQFFIRGRNINLHINYLSQSHFDSPKRTIRIKSDKKIPFIQTFEVKEKIYRDVVGYDKKYDEFKQRCRKSWEEDYKYLCSDRSTQRYQGGYCNCNDGKNTYTEWIPEVKPFLLA